MSTRTAEKEVEVLKSDVMNVLEAVANTIKQKIAATRERGEEVAESLKENIERHPKMTALIGGSVVFGLGLLTAKLLYGKNHR